MSITRTLFFFLLIITLSCSKDSTTNPINSPSISPGNGSGSNDPSDGQPPSGGGPINNTQSVSFAANPVAILEISPGQKLFDMKGIDFNGNGFVDIVSSSSFGHALSVFYNNGAGVFYHRHDIQLSSGRDSLYLVVADFDQDLKEDIAATTGPANVSSNIDVMLNWYNGGINISPINSNSEYSYAVTSLDVDGDFDIDLIASGRQNGVNDFRVYKNNAGAFSFHGRFPTAEAINYLTSGDFNGDGFIDIAA